MATNNEIFVKPIDVKDWINNLEVNKLKVSEILINNWLSEKDTISLLENIDNKLSDLREISDNHIMSWMLDLKWEIYEWTYQETEFFNKISQELNSYMENTFSNLSENQEENIAILKDFFNDLDLDQVLKSSLITALNKEKPTKVESNSEKDESKNNTIMQQFAKTLGDTLVPLAMNRKNAIKEAQALLHK